MEDAMNVVEMLPDELANPVIPGNNFVTAIFGFETRCGAFDATVVDKGPGYMGNLGFENKSDVFMEYSDCVGPTLG